MFYTGEQSTMKVSVGDTVREKGHWQNPPCRVNSFNVEEGTVSIVPHILGNTTIQRLPIEQIELLYSVNK